MRGNPHVRFGGRAEETDQSKHRHRASARSNHYVATRLLTGGVDVRTVAGRLGHRDASTTLNVYAHFLEEADRDAAQLLGNVFVAALRDREVGGEASLPATDESLRTGLEIGPVVLKPI
jgi:hypothetical protein